jgi:hypothetical protein
MDEANQWVIDNMSNTTEAPSLPGELTEKSSPSTYGDNITLAEALFKCTSNAAPTTWGNNEFIKQIQAGYQGDKLFALILKNLPNMWSSWSRMASSGGRINNQRMLYAFPAIEI